MTKYLVVLVLVSNITVSAQPDELNTDSSYSSRVGSSYPTSVYFGDTHIHTNISIDASAAGNINLGLEQAYKFTKGKVVIVSNGINIPLINPCVRLVVVSNFQLGEVKNEG